MVTKSRGGTEHVSSSPSGNDTLSRSIPTMSFNSGVGMMYSVPELPTCIPSFIASDSTVLAKSGTYSRGMFLGGSFSSSLSELFLCWLSLGSVCHTGVTMLFLRALLTRSSGFSVLTSWLFPYCLVYIQSLLVVVISVVSVVGLSLMSLVLPVCSATMENLK